MRARTGAPSSSARPADMTTTAAAASLTPEALPAVTVPSGLNAGLSFENVSSDASSRTCSSTLNSTVPLRVLTSIGTTSSSNRPASRAAWARRWDSSANSSCASREIPCESATFSAVTPIWISLNGSVRAPTTASTSDASPIRAPQRAFCAQYAPRLIDSAPPASTISASPVWIAWAADTIACTPLPHRRLTVNTGASLGMPALIPTTRAMYMSSGAVWITLPNTTCSTWSGSMPARSTAARATIAPSSVGATSRRLRPKEPMAVRAAEVITTSVIRGFLSFFGRAQRSPRAYGDGVLLGWCVRVADLLERVVDLAENRGIVDRGRGRVLLAVGDLAHRRSEDLPGPRFRQAFDDGRGLERRYGADPGAEHLDDLRDDLLVRTFDPGLQDEEPDGQLSLELVRGPDHGALGDVGVGGQHLLDRAGREAVAGDVDDVVGAGHHEHVARIIDVPSVGGLVVAGERRQVGLQEAFVGVPQRRGGAGRHRQLDRQRARLARWELSPVGVQHPEVPAGHRARRRARHHRQQLDSDAVGGDRPPGLGLPPVIDHRHAELLLRPAERLGIAALAGQKQRAEPRQVIAADVGALRVLLTDGAERRRRSEHRADPVLGDHPPERPRVGRPDRLALVQHGRAAVHQRRVHDVGVTHDPADIGRRPEHLARLHVVDVLHRPLQRHRVPAGVAHDSLCLTGRARRVQDVQRIGGIDGHASGRLGAGHGVGPRDVTVGMKLSLELRPLHDEAALGLVLDQLDRRVEQRLVGDQPARLDPA